MPTLIVTTRAGDTKRFEARTGRSVMEEIAAAGINELEAICGGGCACGTCHVYVDPETAKGLGPITPCEVSLLRDSDHTQPTSRLSCQIILETALDGLSVTIAPED